MTLISLSTKIISGHFGSGKTPSAFAQLFASSLIRLPGIEPSQTFLSMPASFLASGAVSK
jgi:hypothetical protein